MLNNKTSFYKVTMTLYDSAVSDDIEQIEQGILDNIDADLHVIEFDIKKGSVEIK